MVRETRRSRGVRTLAVMAGLTLLAAACSGNGEDDAAADGDSSPAADGEALTFMWTGVTESVEPLLAAWEAAHPDVPIDYLEVPFNEFNEVLESRVGAGDAIPDVYGADQPRTADLVRRGFLLDLTDEIDDAEETFLAPSLTGSSVDGRLYSLPAWTGTQFLFVNLEHLEAAGIDPPSADPDQRWTWEETVEAAQASQAAGVEWGLSFEQIDRIYQIQPLPESLGGGNGLTGDDLLTPDFTNDGWIKAMEFYAAIHEDGVAPRGIPSGETRELFQNGQLTFFIASPRNMPIYEQFNDGEGLEFEWAVAAHPYFAEGEPVTPTGNWSWGINPNTENREAALEFIRFATETVEGSLALFDTLPNFPANVEALETYLADDIYQRDFGGATGAELFEYEVENTAVVRAPTAGFIIYEELVGAALEDIRNGQPVQATLETLERDLTEAFGRL